MKATRGLSLPGGQKFLLVCMTLMVMLFILSVAGTVRYSEMSRETALAGEPVVEAGDKDITGTE